MSVSVEFLTDHYNKNFNKLVKRYSKRFDNATVGQDVVQEAYMKAIRYKDTYDPTQPFENWFGVICYNAFRTLCAEELGHATEDLDEFDVAGTETAYEMDRLWAQIIESIGDAKPEAQEVLRLYFEKGYSIMEISEFHIMSHRQIRVHVYAFKKKIKEWLTE